MSHNIFDIVLLRLILQGHLNHYITPHCVITNSVPGKKGHEQKNGQFGSRKEYGFGFVWLIYLSNLLQVYPWAKVKQVSIVPRVESENGIKTSMLKN